MILFLCVTACCL